MAHPGTKRRWPDTPAARDRSRGYIDIKVLLSRIYSIANPNTKHNTQIQIYVVSHPDTNQNRLYTSATLDR